MSFDGKHWIWQKKNPSSQDHPPLNPTYEYPQSESFIISILKFFLITRFKITAIFIIGFLLGAWLF